MDNLPSNGNKNLKNFEISDSQKIGKISKQMKISTQSVRNYISLMDLPKEIQDLIELNFHDSKSQFLKKAIFGHQLTICKKVWQPDFSKIYSNLG